MRGKGCVNCATTGSDVIKNESVIDVEVRKELKKRNIRVFRRPEH